MQRGVSHQPGSGLPQERLEISSSHQLQQDEPGHGLQTDSYTMHNVLVAELTAEAGTETQQGGGIRNGFVSTVQNFVNCVSLSDSYLMIRASMRKSNSSCSEQTSGRVCCN